MFKNIAVQRRVALASVLVTAFTVTSMTAPVGAAAQASPSGAATIEKEAPPPPLPPRALQLPTPVVYKLDNGLTVLLLEDHRVPLVTFQLGIRSGSAQDPKDLPGLASVTADMLTEGTESRTSKQLATEIDRIGAAIKGGADSDFTIISGSGLSGDQTQLFSLLSDVLLHPAFSDEELTLEKTNLLQELTMKRTNPGFLAEERFAKVLYGDHPYSVVAPTPESVSRLTRDDLKQFYKLHYLPNMASLVVIGDFQLAAMKKLIDSDFSKWQAGTLLLPKSVDTPKLSGRTIYLIDRPGSVQSSLKIGNIGIKKTSPDYFPVMLANQILGGSANSRLFLNIREQKGYTYGAYSSFGARVEPGPFSAGAEVRTNVTGPALKEFLYELDRIRTGQVSAQELQSAKNYLIGSFQGGFETQSNLSQKLLEGQLYHLPDNYLATYVPKILAVTAEDVQRAANKYIDYDNLAMTVVGDAKTIEPELRAFGPVQVYDQSGKLLRTDAQLKDAAKGESKVETK